jgi:hypothetical protein
MKPKKDVRLRLVSKNILEGNAWMVMKPVIFVLWVVFGSGDLSGQTSSWQPSPGHTQVSIWPEKAVPDVHPVPGPEVAGTVGSSLYVAGRPWVSVFHVSQPTMTVYSPEGKNTGAAPWRTTAKPTKCQTLGYAVSLQQRFAVIRFPADAARDSGFNYVIFKSIIRAPYFIQV